MWFGDLVTMKWWNDLWLNESFAEWASTIATAEATEWTEAWTTFNAMEKTWAYRQDQLPSTHPVVAEINDLEDVQVNFDGITYAKGGSVLKQLAAWVGIEAFFAGVGAVLQEARVVATPSSSDLLSELEMTSGRELDDLVEEVARDGRRQHAVARDRDRRARARSPASRSCRRRPRTTRRSVRTASASASTTLQRRRARARPPRRARRRRRPHRGARAQGPASAPTSCCSTTRTSPTRRSASTTRSLADGDRAPRRRSATRSPARWCGAPPGIRRAMPSPRRRDYVDLVLRNIGSETESTTVRTTLAQLQLAANSYVAPEKRDATRAKVADAPLGARAGGRGRQRQPAPVRHGVRERRLDARAVGARCVSVRDGEVDARGARDRHRPVVAAARLARRGRASPTRRRSTTALAADNTAKGGEFAAQAKAALPTLEAQAAPRGRRSSTATTCRTRSCARRRSASSIPATRRAARRVRPAVLRHAAADLGLAHATRSRSTSSWACTPRRSRTSTCATRRARGSPRTPTPPRRCAASSTRTSPASSARSPSRSATRSRRDRSDASARPGGPRHPSLGS